MYGGVSERLYCTGRHVCTAFADQCNDQQSIAAVATAVYHVLMEELAGQVKSLQQCM